MVARQYPPVCRIRPRYSRNHIENRLGRPVIIRLHMNLRRARSGMVSDRQRTPPLTRRDRPGQLLQNRLRIRIRKGQHRNLISVLASGIVSRFDPFSDAHPGESGSPGQDGMRRALVPSIYTVLEDFFPWQVRRAPGSTVVPSHCSPADLAGNTMSVVVAGL